MSFDPSSAKLVEETPKPRFNPETARLAEPKRAPFNPSNAIAVDDLPNFTIMDFLRQEEGPTETSPLTPATPEIGERPLTKPLPADETAIIEEQAEGKPIEAVGEKPATVPRFGQEGTVTRGVSDVVGGLVEWGLNNPAELAATFTPLAPAIAMRYAPEIAAGFVKDVGAAVKGDREALGRAATLAALVGGGKAVKARVEQTLVEGKPGVAIESDEWTAERLQAPGAEGEKLREQIGGVEKRNVVEVQPPEVQEQLLPGASETFKEVVGEPASGERATTGEADALSQRETETVPLEKPPGDSTEVGAQVREQAKTESTSQEEISVKPLSDGERAFAESLAKKYGTPVAPSTPAVEPYESLSRFSDMLERAADRSRDATELAQILDAAKGRFNESRIAYAVANNPYAAADTFTLAKANPELRAMASDASLASLDARRAEIRKQRGLDQAPSKPEAEVGTSWYHASHAKLTELASRPVESVDSLGAWLTSSKENARTLYGPNVHRAELPENLKLLEFDGSDPTQIDFNRVLGANAHIARDVGLVKEATILEETLPDTTRLTELHKKLNEDRLTEKEHSERRKLQAAEDASTTLLNSPAYMQRFRSFLQDQGYEGIVWKNSRIDTRKTDAPHDVAVIFNKEPIKTSPLTDTSGTVEAGTPLAHETSPLPAAAPTPSITGIKNARVDQQRAARGLEPLMEPQRKADPVLWQEAMDKIEADPELPTRLTDELSDRPRPMTDVETVIMERELVRISNDLNEARAKGIEAGDAVEKAKKEGDRVAEESAAAKAAEFEAEAQRMSDALVRVEQAVGRQETPGGPGAGTLMGRALRARQLLMREDYSYAGLEKAARQAKGFAPLDAQELLEVRKTAEQFKKLSEDLERRLKEQEQATARAETQRDLANARAIAAKTEATAARKVAKAVDKVGAFLDARADAARERLKGKLLSLSPEDLKDIAEIAAANLYHVGVDFAKWSAKMVEEVGEKVKPHLQTLWEDAQRIVKEATASKTGAKRTPAPQDAAAAVRDRLQARIADYERRIANNDFEPRGQRKPPIDSEEITKARYHLEQIKREWHEKMFELKMARRTAGQKLYGGAVESVNAMRSVLTSADLSAVLRQGLFIGVSHPLRASKSIWPMLRAFADPVKAFEVEQQIMQRRNYPLYRASGLYLAEHGIALSRMEEAYMSRLASQIPLVGRMVKASERAYITYLNKLRADSFDAMAANLGRGGRVTPEQARILSNYINVATGRGTLSVANRIGTDLNTFFFAPKFVASRFQMLLGQPLYYGVLSGKAPLIARGAGRARVMVATEYGRILIGAAVVYGLGMAAGAEVETDPRSSDFGKLRFGNTRIDPMAGVLQVTVLMTRLISGETKSLRSGRITPLRAAPGKKLPYGAPTTWDVLARFGRMKFAPAPGLIVDALTGEDVVGNKVSLGSLATKSLVPISIQDIFNVVEDEGLEKGAAAGVLSIFGAGVQNFDAMRKRD